MAREFVTSVDLKGNRLLGAVLTLENVASTVAPFPGPGRIIHDNGIVKFHDGTTWKSVGTGTGSGTEIDEVFVGPVAPPAPFDGQMWVNLTGTAPPGGGGGGGGGTGDVVSTRLLIAGAGLTGGGDLSADRTFNVGQGTGIRVTADSIAVDQTWLTAAIDAEVNVLGPILQINGSSQISAVESPVGTVTLTLGAPIPVIGTSTPPAVGDAGQLGATTGRYAREDHTHSGVALTGNQSIGGVKTFTSPPAVPSPVGLSDAASKQYVDLVAQGLDFKNSVKVATTANISLTGLQIIDGVSLATGNRVLVKDQVTTSQNGIYAAGVGLWARTTDADSNGEISDGTVVPIEGGTTNEDNLWICTSTSTEPWVADFSGSTWTRFSSGGGLGAGLGLTLTAGTLDVGKGNGILVAADTVSVGAGDGTILVDAAGVKVASAPRWSTARSFTWTGDVTGTIANVDGAGNVTVPMQIGLGVIVDSDISNTAAIQQSKISGLTSTLAGLVPPTRIVGAGAGLTGGGTLDTDVTLNLVGDATLTVTANQVSVASAPRWTTQRTITFGGDTTGSTVIDGTADLTVPLQIAAGAILDGDINANAAIAQTKISGLTADLANRALISRQVIAGPGLTGGGTLTGDVTLTVVGDANLSITADQVAVLSAPKWTTPRSITLTGDVTSSAIIIDGTANVSAPIQIATGVIVDSDVSATAAIQQSKISGLSTALSGLVPATRQIVAGAGLVGTGTLVSDLTIDVVGDANLNVTNNLVSVLSAPKWTTPRSITLTGGVTGTTTGVDGTGNISIATTVVGAGGTEVDEVYTGLTPPPAPFGGQLWVDLTGTGAPPGGGAGGGLAPIYVGVATDNPSPAAYSQWVISDDAGPWASPVAEGSYSLMVSNGTSWFPIAGGTGGGPVMAGPVSFTTKGATFAPKLWQITDSINSIEWRNVATGLVVGTGPTPSITFSGTGTRTIEMWCTRPQDIITLNVGYNTGHDTGQYLPGPNGGETDPNAYNLAPQRVTAIAGYGILTNLVHFMAAGNPDDPTLGTDVLTGATNFSGLAHLEHIECAYARCNSTDLTGCTSLIRLCFEQNQWQGNTLDLNPVRTNLKDLRMAFQNGVSFVALTGPLTQLYHLCVRQQPITNMPVYPNLPALTEHWTWEDSQSGTFVAPPLSADVRIGDNAYTGLDFTHTSSTNSIGQFDASHMTIGANITGLATMRRFNQIFLRQCGLPQATVNAILAQVNAWGRSGGTLWLDNGGTGGAANASPTGGTSNSDYVALLARGYSVQVA